MRMKIGIFQGERTLAELVRRVYDLGPDVDKEVVLRAEKALIRANPKLKHPSEVPSGTFISLPDVLGLRVAVGEHPLEPIAREIIERLQDALTKDVPARFGKKITRLEAETKTSLEILNSPEARKLAEEDPIARRHIAELRETGEAALKEVEILKVHNEHILKELSDDFDSIRAVLNPPLRSSLSES